MSEVETAADGLTDEQRKGMEEYYEQKQREARREARKKADNTGPELIGKPTFGPDETKTCPRCDETTPASEWKPCGPTYRENRRRVKMVVGLGCPNCQYMD